MPRSPRTPRTPRSPRSERGRRGSQVSERGRRGSTVVEQVKAPSGPPLPMCWAVKSNNARIETKKTEDADDGKDTKFKKVGGLLEDYKAACNFLCISVHPHVMMSLDGKYKMVDPENIEEGLPPIKKKFTFDEMKEEIKVPEEKEPESARNSTKLKKKPANSRSVSRQINRAVPEPTHEIRITSMELDKATLRALKLCVPETRLITLRLWNAGVKSENFVELAQLIENSAIKDFMLDENPLGPDEDHKFAVLAGVKSQLQTLSLQSNAIGNKGAEALFDALRTNPKIVALNLARNKIDKLKLIKGQTNINYLNLSHNCFGDEGTVALFKDFSEKTSKKGKPSVLQRLNLSNNLIKDEGCLAALKLSEELKLKLRGNLHSKDLAERIEALDY